MRVVATSNGAGRELSFVASDDDAVSPAAVRWCRIEGLADVPLAEAVRTGDPVFLSSLEHLGERYPHMSSGSGCSVPGPWRHCRMSVGSEAIGGLLLSFGADRHFDHNEQAFLAAFAAQVTQAMKRALKFQVQQTTSELLQRSLMPESIPELTDLAMGAYYEPGGSGVDVGGDWYDVMPLADERVVVALGDVMGKGVPAAIVMGQVRSAMRAYALIDPAPSVMLGRLDTLVNSLGVPEQIVTLIYGVIAADRQSIRLAVAGHPPPHPRTADGGAASARSRGRTATGHRAPGRGKRPRSRWRRTRRCCSSATGWSRPAASSWTTASRCCASTSASSSTDGATLGSCAPGSPNRCGARTATTT